MRERFWTGAIGGILGVGIGFVVGSSYELSLLPCILILGGVSFVLAFLCGLEVFRLWH